MHFRGSLHRPHLTTAFPFVSIRLTTLGRTHSFLVAFTFSRRSCLCRSLHIFSFVATPFGFTSFRSSFTTVCVLEVWNLRSFLLAFNCFTYRTLAILHSCIHLFVLTCTVVYVFYLDVHTFTLLFVAYHFTVRLVSFRCALRAFSLVCYTVRLHTVFSLHTCGSDFTRFWIAFRFSFGHFLHSDAFARSPLHCRTPLSFTFSHAGDDVSHLLDAVLPFCVHRNKFSHFIDLFRANISLPSRARAGSRRTFASSFSPRGQRLSGSC